MGNGTATTTEPRVWVGCLACYNAGRLVGDWFEGTEAGDVVAADLTSLAYEDDDERAEHLTHEELWVFDHEGYGGLLSGECSPAEAQRLAELLEALDDHERAPFVVWVSDGCGDADDVERFQDAYRGEWDTFEQYADQLAEDCGVFAGVPEDMQPYIAIDRWARDLLLGGDYFEVSTGRGTVWVFDARA